MSCFILLLLSLPAFYAQSPDGLAIQWYSQGEQSFVSGWSVNYFAAICPATGLNGAECVFTANLQDQPWNPQFDDWAQMILVDDNGNIIISNQQSLSSNLSFTYSDSYGNITAQVIIGNSDALSFSFVLRCLPPPSILGGVKSPRSVLPRPHQPSVVKPVLIPSNTPATLLMSQYATILEASAPNSGYLLIPVAFCFDMTQQLSTVLVAVTGQDSSSNMEMYVCPDAEPNQCTPNVAPYYDTSASGFLSISMQLQQAEYGTFTIIVKCLGAWNGVCNFAVNARLTSGS